MRGCLLQCSYVSIGSWLCRKRGRRGKLIEQTSILIAIRTNNDDVCRCLDWRHIPRLMARLCFLQPIDYDLLASSIFCCSMNFVDFART
jgi:hypothetical protein